MPEDNVSIYSRICPLCEIGMEEETCPEHHVPTIELASMAESGETLQLGTTLAGRYRIEGFIGKGAMGAVYQAKQLSTDRPVAVKTLRKSFLSDYKLVQRFYREARAVSKLDHPNIVQTFDFGIDPESKIPYIVMEYVHGQELAEMLKTAGALSEEVACTILSQVAKALVEAHAQGVIHRDLKPENIRVRTLSDGDLQAKVLDFGIAKVMNWNAEQGQNLTGTGMTMGTPPYMSPEQIVGDGVDARSDLYSLGCILHQLVTGKLPYTSSERMDIFVKHVKAPPPELPERFSDGYMPSSELRNLHRALLSKERSSRPPDAGVVARMLQALAQSQSLDHQSTVMDAIPDLRFREIGEGATEPGSKILPVARSHASNKTTDETRSELPEGTASTEDPRDASARSDHSPMETGPTSTVAPPVADSTAPPVTPAPGGGRWMAVAAVAVLVAIVVIVAPSNRPDTPPTPSPAPKGVQSTTTRSTTTAKTSSDEQSARPTSRLARVRVLSVPSGARILDAGADLGAAPQDVVFRAGLLERVLRVELAGHVPREIVISRTTPSPYTVTLQRIGLRPTPAKSRPTIQPSRAKKVTRVPKTKRTSPPSSRKKRPGYEIW